MESGWRGCVPNPPSPLIMPCDINNKYWVRGAYQDRTISRMTRAMYPRSRISTHHANTPYRSAADMIARIDDGPGQAWYHDAAHDLHLHDFVFHTRMQTARRIQEHTQRFPDRDMVLERLIAKGTFDRVEPNTPDVREELAMNHASAMVQRLLMRVENLESQVSLLY